MRIFLLTLFLTCLVFSCSEAQKFMQMEKRGSTKVKRYYPGDDILFKVKDDVEWQDAIIHDILVDENLILLGTGKLINIDDIIAIKSIKGAGWSKAIANKFYLFGINWTVLSLITELVGYWSFTWGTAIIAIGAVVTGWLIHTIFKSRVYKIGKKRKLRLLDLTMSPFPGNAYP